MVSEQGASSRKVVIDAGAAIKLQRLERFGGELFTTGGVFREIKDENARALLATLPQELRVREPLAQDILFTKGFAKATGDLGFLSQNDIELIALTVALHREEGGVVKDRPAILQSTEGAVAFDWCPSDVAKPSPATAECDGYPAKEETKEAVPIGTSTTTPAEAVAAEAQKAQPRTFDRSAMKTVESGLSFAEMMRGAKEKGSTGPAKWKAPPRPVAAAPVVAVAHFGEASDKASKSVAEVLAAVEAVEAASEDAAPKTEPASVAANAAAPSEEAWPSLATSPAAAAPTPETSAAAEEAGNDEEDEDDEASANGEWDEDGSSAGEWVTQENMQRFGLGVEAATEVRATCATADYSVQNVLLQMGITPLTFDGFAVRSVKLWGLVCRACFHFTRDTQKVFCSKCGHDTVVRVPIMVDQDGQATMLTTGRPLRKKGTIYSVPKTQGGRGWKPIYAEDEVMIGGRDRQLRHAENIQNKDKQQHDPFNQDASINAWYQRTKGATHPADIPRLKAGLGRANPNANNYKHKTAGRKKR